MLSTISSEKYNLEGAVAAEVTAPFCYHTAIRRDRVVVRGGNGANRKDREDSGSAKGSSAIGDSGRE